MNLALIVSIAGLVVAAIGLFLSRIVTRKVRVRVHRAAFVKDSPHGMTLQPQTPECYFVNVTNISLNREVEITHVWFACSPEAHVIRSERPLPKRLKVDETWETWIPASELPEDLKEDQVYELARVRISNEKVFGSKRNEKVPNVGQVPGGDAPQSPIGTPSRIRPEIISADWGTGEPNYKSKKELLVGYIEAGTDDLRASNQFFHDDYPAEAKHLIVRYRWPGNHEVKIRAFAENDRITF